MCLKKNDFYEIKIQDIGINGEGIGKINNFTIFVDNALPEELVKIKLVKLKKSYGYGKLIEVITPSPFRTTPFCEHFMKCGGCNLQHLDYKEQLKIKSNYVKNNLERIGKLENISVPIALGMKESYNYRNKAQIPVNKKNNKLNIGFFSPRSHTIININNCLIQNKINQQVIHKFREFIEENNIEPYNEESGKGLIRHIVTRVSQKTNELMICLVINSHSFKYEKQLIKKFEDFENLAGIVLNYNSSKTNVILGDKIKTIFGRNYIIDYIDDLKFKISILSFYQVNPTQIEVLYNKVLEFANLKGNEIVIDAYCGIGTISLFLAKKSKKVYGIEIVEPAIKDAIYNARENNIDNVEFITGKSEVVIPTLINDKNIVPDVLVLDPPRKGCEQSMLDTIINAKIKKIVYVSCNPSTLSRDLNCLCKNGYKLEKVQPIDMFCFTTHIESVVLLSYENM